jgi:plasmid replication initiation protein
MNFWEQPEWIKLKTFQMTTDKILNRVEYLQLVGYKHYSDEGYQKYLQAMEIKTQLSIKESYL